METRNVKISLETAQRWCNGTNNELKELAVQTYPEVAKKELPKSWEELGKPYATFINVEQGDAFEALHKLSQLIKVYNDGWKPDWSDSEYKYCVGFTNEKLDIGNWIDYKQFLAFKDKKTAELFLENFRELIETAKPLL
jgi:hypothetical protein